MRVPLSDHQLLHLYYHLQNRCILVTRPSQSNTSGNFILSIHYKRVNSIVWLELFRNISLECFLAIKAAIWNNQCLCAPYHTQYKKACNLFIRSNTAMNRTTNQTSPKDEHGLTWVWQLRSKYAEISHGRTPSRILMTLCVL